MNILAAVLLGIVEGITEFLPVSSTGHLILAQSILGIRQTDFTKTFDMVIQLGAILAVGGLYAKKLLTQKNLWLPLVLAFLPTGIFGVLLYKPVKQFLLGNDIVVAVSLFLGGIVIIAIERWNTTRQGDSSKTPTNRQALTVGTAQILSFIPGVSRSAATIAGGMLSGLSRIAAVEFSFLLSVPTMAAAVGYDLIKTSFSLTTSETGMIAVGFVCACASALITMKSLLAFVKTHSFIPFGWYRIAVAILYAVFMLRG